ncbi:MAG TPA: hypothetical protein VEQ84_12955 [Vicinamibacteria bacterium]|nr:hypothetical protein [Vicinamibacteria bacterium]
MLTAAVIFTATYVVVALGRVPGLRLDRTGAAVVGAAFMIAFHVVSAEEAFRITPLVPSLPDPTRAWLALAMSSTLAGTLTLLGSIANLIVAEGARRTAPISFSEYLKVGVPVTVASLVAGLLLLGPR